jgi:hypothetical protein
MLIILIILWIITNFSKHLMLRKFYQQKNIIIVMNVLNQRKPSESNNLRYVVGVITEEKNYSSINLFLYSRI